MSQDDFIERHGRKVWEDLVRPWKERRPSDPKPPVGSLEFAQLSHPNTLADADIGYVLRALGFEGGSLLQAQEELGRLRAATS